MLEQFLFKNVKLIAVSKTRTVSEIQKIYNSGQKDFGENYLQEALKKINQLPKDIIWHFIGPIQSNKTKDIVQNFDVIHSVDRLKIAQRLNNQTTKKLKILIQVNIDNEESKAGVCVQNLAEFIQKISKLENLVLQGLMCIPAKDNSRSSFAKMYKLKQQYNLVELSMGMSSDYQEAIDNGTTMIRIGTAIFGARK